MTRETAKDPLFLFSGRFAKQLADAKISEIEPMAKISYMYDWEKLMEVIKKDFD